MAEPTNAQVLYQNFINRFGLANPVNAQVGAAITAGANGGVPVTTVPAVAPTVQSRPTTTPPVPAAAPVPSVNAQLAAQDASRQAQGLALVNSLPSYTPNTNAAQPVTATAPVATPRPSGGGGGGASRFTNPADAIQTGYNQQINYAQNMANLIQTLASKGDPNNYSFRLAHLSNALTGGNFAAVQGQGVDALNQSIAGITSAGIGAGAQMYGADQGLAAHLANIGEQRYQFENGVVPGGSSTTQTDFGPMTVTDALQRKRNPTTGMVEYQPVGSAADRAASKYQVGKSYKDAQGNVRTYQSDGTWK